MAPLLLVVVVQVIEPLLLGTVIVVLLGSIVIEAFLFGDGTFDELLVITTGAYLLEVLESSELLIANEFKFRSALAGLSGTIFEVSGGLEMVTAGADLFDVSNFANGSDS